MVLENMEGENMKNKKGFTLVELLAVIVILALIMSIAVISIGGVLDSAKTDTFKETGASIIDWVKKQLLIKNKLEAGDYTFTSAILDKGGKESPFGGNINYDTGCTGTTATGICKSSTTLSCSANATSFVRIDADKTARICLATDTGTRYINLITEAALLGSGDVIS